MAKKFLRVQMLASQTVDVDDSTLSYAAGEFYNVDEKQALAWIAGGVAIDPDAPEAEPEKAGDK